MLIGVNVNVVRGECVCVPDINGEETRAAIESTVSGHFYAIKVVKE